MAIKGWKHAVGDIMKHRSEQGKTVHLHSLKNDGGESGMHDAKKTFRSEDEARRHHTTMVGNNPGRKIRHNLYVDGKFKEKLGEMTDRSISNAAAFLSRTQKPLRTIRDHVERVDEISVKKADAYRHKATDDSRAAERSGDKKRETKRDKGRHLAFDKAIGRGVKVKATEETQLDEVSAEKAGKYVSAAAKDLRRLGRYSGHATAPKETKYLDRLIHNRHKGIDRAVGKLIGNKRTVGTDGSVRKHAVKVAAPRDRFAEDTQLDEISKALAGRYLKKAKHSAAYDYSDSGKPEMVRNDGPGGDNKMTRARSKTNKQLWHRYQRRNKGMDRAINRLTKEETLDEISNKTVRSYATKASAQYFRGGEKANTYKKRAAGLYKAGRKLHKAFISQRNPTEETQLDEISKGLAARYIGKSSNQAAMHSADYGRYAGSSHPDDIKRSNKSYKKAVKRLSGVETATNKLVGNKVDVHSQRKAFWNKGKVSVPAK